MDAYDQMIIRRLYKKRQITENGCWEWTGHLVKGYGQVRYNSDHWPVHSLILLLTRPEEYHSGKIVMHLCNNTKCFNPDHLKGGTDSQNKLGLPTVSHRLFNEGTRYKRIKR